MTQDDLVRILLAGGLPVPAQDTRTREQIPDFRLDTLTAQAILADVSPPAFRALDRFLTGVAAMMTDESFFLIDMKCQGVVTLWALQRITAIPAKDIGCSTTPV
jgi:hypothetical protein